MNKKDNISRIKLPSPNDTAPHPRLLVDGWHNITLEVSWNDLGPACWYISTPKYRQVCPVGSFVKI